MIEHPRRVLETLLVEIDQLETERGRLVVRIIADDGDVLPFLTDFHQQRLADVLRRVVAVFRPGRHDQLEFRELLGERDRFVPLGVREQNEEFRVFFFERGDGGRQHRLGILDGDLRIGGVAEEDRF